MSEPTRRRRAPVTVEPSEDQIEPAADLEEASGSPAEDDQPKSSSKTVRLTYTGQADVIDIGGHIIRPGQPVSVPSEVAEELLTMPFEQFEVEE